MQAPVTGLQIPSFSQSHWSWHWGQYDPSRQPFKTNVVIKKTNRLQTQPFFHKGIRASKLCWSQPSIGQRGRMEKSCNRSVKWWQKDQNTFESHPRALLCLHSGFLCRWSFKRMRFDALRIFLNETPYLQNEVVFNFAPWYKLHARQYYFVMCNYAMPISGEWTNQKVSISLIWWASSSDMFCDLIRHFQFAFFQVEKIFWKCAISFTQKCNGSASADFDVLISNDINGRELPTNGSSHASSHCKRTPDAEGCWVCTHLFAWLTLTYVTWMLACPLSCL